MDNQDKILNGKEIAGKLKNELTEKVEKFFEEYKCSPTLAIVVAGNDPSSETYIRSKERTCKKVGIKTQIHRLSETSSLAELQDKLSELNTDREVNGIILELPLPPQIPYTEAVSCISPLKDVDGLNPVNLGYLYYGKPVFISSTPKAVMKILEEYDIPLEGRDVTVIGRSISVGRPVAALLMHENATVTICHSRTKNVEEYTRRADVLVVSVGKPSIVTGEMIKEGAVVIDVGINVTDDGVVGDVEYESAYQKSSKITPVPGGVGPITVTMILENTLKAARMQMRMADNSNACE
jgi:methylenetetrahydrofolate dehydrogenase (NADP+) / methenyltetrahydrofolate cyclohydrolase